MTGRRSVAVLGAGIMGCSTALYLARRGLRVVLFDEAAAPFSGASRWNEGKIHLGYLYSADRSLETARLILPGGLTFKPIVEDLIGQSIASVTTADDDVYLIHRDSVVTAAESRAYLERVAEMVRDRPDAREYLVDARSSRVEALTADDIEAVANPAVIVAGYRVLERSVSTRWVADQFVAAVEAESRITTAMEERVVDVASTSDGGDGPWQVHSTSGSHGPFDYVVNALWHGRPAIDRRVGNHVDDLRHHRYRLALFLRSGRPIDMPSLLIGVGPYGDVKNYGGRDFYLSWYPVGRVIESEGSEHPEPPVLDAARRSAIARGTFQGLAAVLPGVASLEQEAVDVQVQGGWVYAQARGSLNDPHSTLHKRDLLGIRWFGTYVSVDTGKYSMAPLLAKAIADRITIS